MKILLTYLLIIFSFMASADVARQAYLNKDFLSAKQSYQQMQERSPNNFSYNYNLGATHYRLDNPLLAKYYFLKALKIKPSNKDTRYNISLINKSFIDQQFMFKKYWIHFLTVNIKTVLSILMIITLLILYGVYAGVLKGRSNRTKRVGWVIILIITILSSITTVCWLYEPEYALIKLEKVQIYSGPSETQKPLFFAHKGAECKIVKSSSIWANIQFPNGLKGWIKERDIIRI